MSRIILAGGQNIGSKILDFLVNQADHQVVGVICRADDQGNDSVFPSLMKKALEYDIPVLKPIQVNQVRVVETIHRWAPDILISAAFNQIFRKEIINIFDNRLGIINIHYAPLPKYSGFWPEMWAIWNEDTEFGVTFHYINEGIDTGDIVYQELFAIEESETRKSLYEKCDFHSFKIFEKNYYSFLSEKQQSYKQNENDRIYLKKGLPNNGILDLSWEPKKIERFVRAVSFYPFIGAKIKIGKNIYSIVEKDLEFYKPYFIGD